MAFQFQCPQGHLLEGDPSQAGQQCQCPECGTLFIIPEPVTAQPEPEPEPALPGPPGPPDFARVAQGGNGGTGGAFDPFGQSPGGIRTLHIPCPNGHELETPPDMLNEDVMCPHCGVQFTLRERDSIEFKRTQREKREREEHETGQKWFTWAIVIAVVIAVGLITMIAVSASR